MALVLWLERRKMVEMAKNDPNFHVFLNNSTNFLLSMMRRISIEAHYHLRKIDLSRVV